MYIQLGNQFLGESIGNDVQASDILIGPYRGGTTTVNESEVASIQFYSHTLFENLHM